jgi:hypothetical protein
VNCWSAEVVSATFWVLPVRVLLARATVPPLIVAGLTEATAGVPAVPLGTVMVIELSDDGEAVVNV